MGFVKCFIEALRVYIEVSSAEISLSLMTQLIFFTSVSKAGNAFLVQLTPNLTLGIYSNSHSTQNFTQ